MKKAIVPKLQIGQTLHIESDTITAFTWQGVKEIDTRLSVESLSPTLFSVGSGGVIGFLIGFAIKKVMKILAVVVGIFFGAMMYLQSQGIINVDWDKLQQVSRSLLTNLGNSLTDTSQISTIAGNLGIPLTGGLAAGFAIGIMKA
jgi:uncharacterized membrane protein (Fun14 family)